LHPVAEGHKHAIRLKVEIMPDHFHEQLIIKGMIGDQVRIGKCEGRGGTGSGD